MTVTSVAGRRLEPKRIKEHRITIVPIFESRQAKILQLGDEEKVLDGEVELFHGSLLGFHHPSIKFNGAYVGTLEISQYSHPMRKEFWYSDDNRAPFAEMLRECHTRKIEITFPGLLHFDPEPSSDGAYILKYAREENPNNLPIGIVTVYCDLPTAAEVKREYPRLRL